MLDRGLTVMPSIAFVHEDAHKFATLLYFIVLNLILGAASEELRSSVPHIHRPHAPSHNDFGLLSGSICHNILQILNNYW